MDNIFEIKDASKFLGEWYIPAIKDVLTIYNFDGSDYDELAQLFIPKITVDEAEHAISELEKASIIEKKENGIYHVKHKNVRVADTQENTTITRAYQKQLFGIAKTYFNKPKKDNSFVYVGFQNLTRNTLFEVKKLNKQYRKRLHKIAAGDKNENTLYQILFSVTPAQDDIINLFNLINYSIDNVEKNKRDISTVALSLSDDGFRETKELLENYEGDLNKVRTICEIDQYTFGCCMYPLTKEIKKK